MSKALDKTIRSNTERKTSVDNLIMGLSAEKEDEDIVEGNEDTSGIEDAGNSNAGGENGDETDGSEDI